MVSNFMCVLLVDDVLLVLVEKEEKEVAVVVTCGRLETDDTVPDSSRWS